MDLDINHSPSCMGMQSNALRRKACHHPHGERRHGRGQLAISDGACSILMKVVGVITYAHPQTL